MISPGGKAKKHSDKSKDDYYKKLVTYNLFLEPKGRERPRSFRRGINYAYVFLILGVLLTLAYFLYFRKG
jgi:hypothetical protein